MLSLGDTAQSAETVGNRLSFVDKIPSQAPSMHEPEDADAEDADDDDEACSRRRRHGVRGCAAPKNLRTESVRRNDKGNPDGRARALVDIIMAPRARTPLSSAALPACAPTFFDAH